MKYPDKTVVIQKDCERVEQWGGINTKGEDVLLTYNTPKDMDNCECERFRHMVDLMYRWENGELNENEKHLAPQLKEINEKIEKMQKLDIEVNGLPFQD